MFINHNYLCRLLFADQSTGLRNSLQIIGWVGLVGIPQLITDYVVIQ